MKNESGQQSAQSIVAKYRRNAPPRLPGTRFIVPQPGSLRCEQMGRRPGPAAACGPRIHEHTRAWPRGLAVLRDRAAAVSIAAPRVPRGCDAASGLTSHGSGALLRVELAVALLCHLPPWRCRWATLLFTLPAHTVRRTQRTPSSMLEKVTGRAASGRAGCNTTCPLTWCRGPGG